MLKKDAAVRPLARVNTLKVRSDVLAKLGRPNYITFRILALRKPAHFMTRKEISKLIGEIIADILLIATVYWLWNWLMPVIFGLPRIGFWQAFGLQVLCNLLFKRRIRKEYGQR